jgi:plasmid stability protein
MIHIRLDETTHRKLKIRVAHNGTTIQHLVADLIRREVGESEKSKKKK